MPSDPQATSSPHRITSFSVGQANTTHAGFSQTSAELPDSTQIWSTYFNNVLRGSTDIDGTTVISKTFSDTSSTGEGPPDLEAALTDTAGNTVNSYIPDVSAEAEAGVYPDSGHLGDLGSITSPSASSNDQPASSVVGDGESPSYVLGEYSS